MGNKVLGRAEPGNVKGNSLLRKAFVVRRVADIPQVSDRHALVNSVATGEDLQFEFAIL